MKFTNRVRNIVQEKLSREKNEVIPETKPSIYFLYGKKLIFVTESALRYFSCLTLCKFRKAQQKQLELS